MRYTATTVNAFPTFNSNFEYNYIITPKDGEYLYQIIAKNDTKITTMKCDNSSIQKTITSVEYLDTSNITNMSFMFGYCTALTSLDVSNFNTSKVTDMSGMFCYCTALTSLDVSNFDTSNVTNMSGMFYYCTALTSLDVSNFNTSKVTDMGGMFCYCTALTSLDLSNFDVSKVTNMNSMFNYCTALTSLDVNNFNTSKVTNMNSMFGLCADLKSLDVSNFDTSNVTDMGSMFYCCMSLTSLDLSNFDVSKVTNMSDMFNNCTSLQLLNVTGWPDNSYTKTAMSSLPIGNDAKNEIYSTVYFTVPSGWEIISPFDILIYTCSKSGVKPTFNSEFTGYTTNETNLGSGTYRVKIATNALTNLPTSVSFENVTTLKTFEKINGSNLTTMAYMFKGCTNLTSVDLSNCDCSNVTNTSSMFENCSNVKTIDLTNTNMKIIGMNFMFKNCTVLEEIKCDGWLNESQRGYEIPRWNCSDLTRGSDKLKTDLYMYLCSVYIMAYYENTDSTEPRVIDFSGIDTSKIGSVTVRSNTTSILNLHSEIGIDFTLRFCSSLTRIENLHFKWQQYGFGYYGIGSQQLTIIFDTTENSTNYKYENWTPGTPNLVLAMNASNFTVDTIVSFLNCLYDYRAKGESTNATLNLGNNLNRLTPAQIAIATNKGWTLT